MIFEPGNSYYMLDSDQYDELVALIEAEELDYDLASNFQLADDGNYYAAVTGGGVDSEEAAFMEDFGLSNILAYKKSNQSTSFY